MKKKVVKKVKEPLYIVSNSDIGPLKPKNHPYNFQCVFSYSHGLQAGDILRCDGLPFMSRPKPIKTIEYSIDTNGLIIHRTRSIRENITHRPVQLPTSLWVLRPIENID